MASPHLPWLLNVLPAPPANPSSEYCFQVEPFAPVLTVVPLQAEGTEQFLDKVGQWGCALLS
jgi:hypothetical protein